MPIYEYSCRQCGNEFELLILKSSGVPACPSCQSAELEQLLSGFAVSSQEMRLSNAAASRRKEAASSGVRDQRVAQAETMQKEHADHDE